MTSPTVIPISVRTELSDYAQLVLIAISTRERRRANAARVAALADRVKIDGLARYIGEQRLSFVVPSRLGELGFSELARALEERLAPRRKQLHGEATVHAVLTDSILTRLEDEGIPALALKGVNLAQRLYGDPAGRESRDIDILVPAELLDEASTIMQKQFLYAAPVDALAKNRRPLLHYSLRHPSGFPSLELHWRVHWYESSSGAAMLRRSSMANGFREMSLSDELASLLLFYARDGFVGFRNLAAIPAWWDRHASELPAPGLAEFVREFPALAPALATSARVAAQLTGTSLPALGLGLMPLSRRQRRAAQLANPQPEQAPNRVQADVALVDLLLAPRLDITTFARRQMLLNTSYRDARSAAGGLLLHHESRLPIEGIVSRAGRMLIRFVENSRRG